MTIKTRQDVLRMLEELLEMNAGTLKGDEILAEINWDSLGVVSFMAMADEKFGIILSAETINRAKVVGDLLALLGDKVAG